MAGEQQDDGKRVKRVLLCATGAYLCYSLPRFILHLLHHFTDDVQVVLSRAAATMVSPYTVEVASRNRVFIEMNDTGEGVYVPHIELSRGVDLIVVLPASTSIIGKVANGITDELISALIVAARVPVLFVPAANAAMLDHPAVRRNIERLEADGYVVLPPVPGPEVATREDMELLGEAFPLPTLLLQMIAAVSDSAGRGRAHRAPPGD